MEVGINSSKIVVNGTEVDLTSYQGQYVRVYIDFDNKIVINPSYDCYWQVAEVYVPYLSSIKIKEDGSYENVIEPLDLTQCDVTLFDLPGGAV